MESDTLASYLKYKLGCDVTCEKIVSKPDSARSKISAICKEVGEMYEPQLWPEGTFVRRFFEVCKPRAAGGVRSEPTSINAV